MSRINTNVQSMIAQRVLSTNQMGLSQSLERLSTGVKINRGKDDPAGLIAAQNLRAEGRALNAAISNADRADQVMNIAEGGLQEVSSMLTELQGLVTSSASSAGLSAEERKANQLQIDSILQTIDRVASSSNFQGIKLLNGNFDFKVSGVASGVEGFKINGAKYSGASLDVDVLVTNSAQQGGLFLSAGGSSLDLGGATSSFVIEIAGALGSRELTFSSTTSLTSIRDAINTFTDVTGVEATVSGTGIKLSSDKFGGSQFVSVKVVDDGGIGTASNVGIYNMQDADFGAAKVSLTSTFAAATNVITDRGQDLVATINGVTATGDGKTARVNTDMLDVEVTLDDTKAQTLGSVGSQAFTITGGGADFQLASKVDIAGKVSVGIGNVAARNLGSTAGGFLADLGSGKTLNLVDTDGTDAQKVVAEAINQVSALRGRLGAFQKNTIGATIRSLGIAVENTAAAESVIKDADFAAETANLTRSQILVSASTNILGMANQQPQTVLQLLG